MSDLQTAAMSPLPDAAAAAPTETPSMKKPANNGSLQAKKTRVIVLGAGMSGLACARELQQRGYRVLVVEARDRPGGRLKGGTKTNDREGGNEGMKTLPNSIISPDKMDVKPASKSRNKKETTTPVDLGGALIHGIESNPIYALTEQMGIPTRQVSECLLVDGAGWPVDTKEDERIANLFNDCLEETFDRVAKIDEPGASEVGLNQNDDSDKPKASEIVTQSSAASIPNEAATETTSASAADASASQGASDMHDNKKEKKTAEPLHDQPSHPEAKRASSTLSLSEDNHTNTFNEEKKDASESSERPEVDNIQRPSRSSSRISASRKRKASTAPQVEPERDETKPSSTEDDKEESLAAPGVPPPSFGDVFDQVCIEKGAPRGYPLFEWHQANLEVSCGASFPGLGYKWNDDEPYGFDGAHVALKTSWKPVMEVLTEGIDVLYQNPVKKVVLVVPDPPPESPSEPIQESLQARDQNSVAVATTPQTATATASLSSLKRKRKRPTPTEAPLPSRFSRRIRGDDADARRSSRANKGKSVDRFLVNEFSKGSYDDPNGKLQSPKGSRKAPPEPEDSHTTVQVTLENGTVLEAEAVVCTLPLGILKLQARPEGKKKRSAKQEDEGYDSPLDDSSGAVTFYPPLSDRKQTAIHRLGCGLLNKCVLSFPHVFWQDSDFLGVAHPANSYLVLNAAKFTNKPILTFMYGGGFAKEIESWTDNEIIGDCMEVIRILCGRRDIPDPLDYAVTRWGHERFSRMSFSYVPPGVDGMEEYRAMNEAIYDPLVPKKPVIMFAGEHTTPFHPSTMHGAFLSGIREAYRLDLVVEAEANENLEFDDEHIYQHTFAVRRLFASARSPVARAPPQQAAARAESATSDQGNNSNRSASSRRQHRRRGAATTVMNLRQRPENDQSNRADENPAATRRRRPQQSDQARARNAGSNGAFTANRSRRSVYSMEQQTVKNDTSKRSGNVKDVEEAALQKKQLSSLESRTLMRALESYGHNYPYIQSAVLPVFGSGGATKTLPQVRARCQQMIRSILSSASAAIPKRVLASWVPKEVYVPPPPTAPAKRKKKTQREARGQGKPFSRGRASRTPDPHTAGSRRSSRQQKQRHLMNL